MSLAPEPRRGRGKLISHFKEAQRGRLTISVGSKPVCVCVCVCLSVCVCPSVCEKGFSVCVSRMIEGKFACLSEVFQCVCVM